MKMDAFMKLPESIRKLNMHLLEQEKPKNDSAQKAKPVFYEADGNLTQPKQSELLDNEMCRFCSVSFASGMPVYTCKKFKIECSGTRSEKCFTKPKNLAKVKAGRKGGLSKSPAKRKASKENGLKNGLVLGGK